MKIENEKKKKLIFSLYSFQLSNIKVCVYINNVIMRLYNITFLCKCTIIRKLWSSNARLDDNY